MNPSSRKKHQDYWLSLAIFALIAIGLVMIYSVSKYYSLQITDEKTDKYYLIRQLRWVGLGVIAWIGFQSIDYRYWHKKSSLMLILTAVLLLLPFLPFGHGGGAGERWFGWGIFVFQPSEVAKLTLIFYLSALLSNKGDDLTAVKKNFIPFTVVVLAVSFMMLIQKDLGSLVVMLGIAAAVFVVSGAPISQIGLGGAGLAVLGWLAIKIEPYRMQRFLTFLNPNQETLGASYHIRNALIAVGSGGLWGLGFGQSKQKYLYLPEAHTDSIFAIICEELGFIRAPIILAIFAFIGVRGYRIASRAPDTFSRLVATGITTWLISQMLVNIGAMLSLLPLTGVPLPFISYGGSSLIILLSAVGVLVNISKSQIVPTQLARSQR